jgi:hypothetical protein
MLARDDFKSDHDYTGSVEWHDKAKELEHKYWVNEIPVHPHLCKFYNEFKHKRPDAIVHPSTYSDHLKWFSSELKTYDTIHFAFKEAPDVVVGSIKGFTGDGNVPMYFVISERINNERYATYSNNFHTKSTKKLPNAMKTALQYIKPFDLEYMANREQNKASHAIENLKEKANDTLYYKFDADRRELFKEVSNMVNAGYTPSTSKFVQMMEICKNEGEMMKELLAYKPRKCFVWAKTDRVEYKYDDEQVVIAYSLDEVPEDIRNKVAVLQIAEKASPIKDVGVKVSESTYWIFV